MSPSAGPSALTALRIISTIALLCSTDFGDFLETRPSVLNCRHFLAVLDNLIHVWIGLLSWTVVTEDPWPWGLTLDFAVVALGASFIDVDHFIAARSFRVENALNAGHRGIFHCTGLALVIFAIILKYRPHWALLFLVAVIPHHVRDAQRRGLYLMPLWNSILSTHSLPKGLVRLFLPIFPWVLLYFKKYFVPTGNVGFSKIFNV